MICSQRNKNINSINSIVVVLKSCYRAKKFHIFSHYDYSDTFTTVKSNVEEFPFPKSSESNFYEKCLLKKCLLQMSNVIVTSIWVNKPVSCHYTEMMCNSNSITGI